MVINLIFDKPDICAHEGFGHSVSLDHSLCNTHSHTYRYFLSLSLFLFHCFLLLTQLSRTSLTSDPVPLGTVIDFSSDPLNLGWRRVRTGELVAIVRYSGGDAEDEGERSMCADGWACISRNNSQPWRKSRGLEARCVSNTDAGVRADGGGWRKGRRGLVMFQMLENLPEPQSQVICEKQIYTNSLQNQNQDALLIPEEMINHHPSS